MIANRNRGRIPGSAVPGAWRRAQFAKLLERQYGSRFALYGHGWEGNSSWRGPLAFDEQGEANRSAWVSASWDHFPSIANYTSNRAPISLASGVPHVSNYRPGFELMYPPGSGLFWAGSVRAVAEMVAVVLALPRDDLLALGEQAARLCPPAPLPGSPHGAPARGCIGVPIGHCSAPGVNPEPLLGLEETDGLDPTEAVLSLTDRTMRGLFWSYSSVALTVVLQIGYTMAISRRLAPADFGLVAFAGLPISLATYFANMGISSAVVQKPELDDRDVRVAFTGSVTAGLVVSAILALTAPAIAALFGNPDVTPILRVLAISFAVTGFGSVALGLLRRQMRFRQIAIIEVGSYAVAYPVIGLTLAGMGAGVWSLVGASLAQTVLVVSLAYGLERHAARPLLDGERAKRIYGFGGLVSVCGILEFFGCQCGHLRGGAFPRHGKPGAVQPGESGDRPPHAPFRHGGHEGAHARFRPAQRRRRPSETCLPDRTGPARVPDVPDGGRVGRLGPAARSGATR